MINILLCFALGGCGIGGDIPDTMSVIIPYTLVATLYHADSLSVYPVADSGFRVGNDGDTLLGEYRTLFGIAYSQTLENIDTTSIISATLQIGMDPIESESPTDSVIIASSSGSWFPVEATWDSAGNTTPWDGGDINTTNQVTIAMDSEELEEIDVTEMVKYWLGYGILPVTFVLYSENHTADDLITSDPPLVGTNTVISCGALLTITFLSHDNR